MTDDLAQYLENLPTVAVGAEHEYKWLLDPHHGVTPDDAPDLVVSRVPLAGYRVVGRATTAQSGIYVDDSQWSLASGGVSLTVIVNHGWRRELAWLVLKQTMCWDQGRRDAVEYAVRVRPGAVGEALTDWSLLPLEQLSRALGRKPELRPYALTTQRRGKVDIASDAGSLLSMSVDHSTIRPASRADGDGDGAMECRWLEIESNQTDGRSIRRLAEWARTIADYLGAEPSRWTKPGFAAASFGWEPPAEGGP